MSPPSPMPNKELLKAECSIYFEMCCSCRRRTNWVEKIAANKPTIGKIVLASGIGFTTRAHSSKPPELWKSALPKWQYM